MSRLRLPWFVATVAAAVGMTASPAAAVKLPPAAVPVTGTAQAGSAKAGTAKVAAAEAAGTIAKTSGAKPAGLSNGASVPTAVTAAVARGPVDLLVGYDLGPGISRIRAATTSGFGAGQRRAATAAAVAEYGRQKRTAFARAGSGVSLRHDYDHLPVQLVRVSSPAALDALAAAPGVSSIQLQQKRTATDSAVWLGLSRQPEAVAAGHTGSGVQVAVLDTGADYTNPTVQAALGDCSSGPGTDSCRIDSYVDAAGSGQLDVDPHRHGTNVSGIVATVSPQAHLAVYNVFTLPAGATAPEASDGDILAALNAVSRDAAANNIRAVNLSLGSGGYHSAECAASIYSTAFLNLRALGVVPVVAAGNDAHDSTGTFHTGIAEPACAEGALSVGAVYATTTRHSYGDPVKCTDTNPAVGSVACFSQTGPLLDLLAPGVDIDAAGITMSGTSQATPNVAGAVADLVSANPSASAQQLVRALTTSGPLVTDPHDGTTVHRLDIAAAAQAVTAAPAEVSDAGCTASSLAANDDGSSASVTLPFTANFFGASYPALFVNNNGNVTFQAPQARYTPFTIDANTPPMIAPFFADVDTRGAGSSLVTYGTTTFGARPAFCVNWNSVGYYSAHDNKLNSFQLLLVDRGDVGAGDFDIVMNYNALTWETGDASGGANGLNGTAAGAGFSAGDGNADHFFQFPGSLVHNGLLDSNSSSPNTALVNGSRGTLQTGRYIFPVRNGAPPGSSALTGTVRDANSTALGTAPVQACPVGGGSCVIGFTGGDGRYSLVGLAPGSWLLTAFPPAGSDLSSAAVGPVTVASGSTVTQDLTLQGPTPPPAGTTITNRGTTGGGIPIVFWTEALVLSTSGCAGATADYTITQGGATLRSGPMTESPARAGHYSAEVAALYPLHGNAQVTIVLTCPDATVTTIGFTIYIDPSGTVVDTLGHPITEAEVTLLRADTAAGPFTAVADGSAVMSPSQRHNPVTTGADGAFHWDVVAGFYQVQAAKTGCTAVGGGAEVTSATYEVPPPALDLRLVLDCGENANASATVLTAAPTPAVAGQPVALTATVTGPDPAPTGTVAFSAVDGSVTGCTAQPVTVGQATCTVTFPHVTSSAIALKAEYSGDSAHTGSTGTLDLTVNRATPVITWAPPADISYPTPLGQVQLNATADVPGTFTYSVAGQPASGLVLHPGDGQLITVEFTPADGDHTIATAQVPITVLPGPQVITADAMGPVALATGSVTVTAHGGPSGSPVQFTTTTPAVCTVASASGSATATAQVALVATGTCTLSLTQAGTTDWAAAAPVSVSFAVTGAPVSAGPTLERSVSADLDRSGRLRLPALSTAQGGDLVVALVSTNGSRSRSAVAALGGGGLRWTRVSRPGPVEVWQAWAASPLVRTRVTVRFDNHVRTGSVTVAAFTDAGRAVGQLATAAGGRGRPRVRLTPERTGSLVWSVGTALGLSRVNVPPGQEVVHQKVGSHPTQAFWVSSLIGRTTTTDPLALGVTSSARSWQLIGVEILPAAANAGSLAPGQRSGRSHQ